jgi:uncharacterized repeat protein (TIGR03803 family)
MQILARFFGIFLGLAVIAASPAAEAATFTLLHSFAGGADGAFPNAVVFDTKGALYGTASMGGSGGYGTVFKLAP